MAYKAAFRTYFKVSHLLLVLYIGDLNSLQYSCTAQLLLCSLLLLFTVFFRAVAQGSGPQQVTYAYNSSSIRVPKVGCKSVDHNSGK